MRSTLLASCLLGLTFVVGCDDAKKTETTAEPAPTVAPATAEPGKGAMEGPKGGAMEGPKGAMDGPAATPATTDPTAGTPAPTPNEKKEETPKS